MVKTKCAQGLMDLLKQHTFDAITVQMIINQAQISRATFYRYFKDKEDLLTYLFHHEISQHIFVKDMQQGYFESSTIPIRYVQKNYSFFINVISDENNTFIKLLFNKYIQFMSKQMPKLTPTQYEVLMIYLHGTILTAVSWFRHGTLKSPTEMGRLFKLAMPEILNDIFND